MDADLLVEALAHDLKNRLAVLTQELQFIEPAHLKEPERARLVNARAQASACVHKLQSFVVDSAAKAGRLQCMPELEAVRVFLPQVAERAKVFVPAHVEVATRLDGAPARAYFDYNLVQLALDAALDNAAKFARSRIVLSAKEGAQGGIIFQVENDLRDELYERTFEALSAREASSTGMGLHVVEAVAGAHENMGHKGHSWLELDPDKAVLTISLP